jgi:hypothetical protein
MARYESFAALQVIVESGNAKFFRGLPPKHVAWFLRKQFKTRRDEFIMGDDALSKLNPDHIEYFPLACVLSCGGDAALLDEFCSI